MQFFISFIKYIIFFIQNTPLSTFQINFHAKSQLGHSSYETRLVQQKMSRQLVLSCPINKPSLFLLLILFITHTRIPKAPALDWSPLSATASWKSGQLYWQLVPKSIWNNTILCRLIQQKALLCSMVLTSMKVCIELQPVFASSIPYLPGFWNSLGTLLQPGLPAQTPVLSCSCWLRLLNL